MSARRIGLALAAVALPAAGPVLPDYPTVRPGVPMTFPRDHGAHPAFRTEWWYVTGSLRTAAGEPLGFQVTFFRSRPAVDQRNPSAFAAKQILFAHAALSDPASGRLLHDQRAARAGFGIAEAKGGDANVVLRDWRFVRTPDGRFRTHAAGKAFALDLAFAPTQPPLLQGEAGYSRKGPSPEQASYYYSIPHLAVSGSVVRGGRRVAVTGEAWLDREWSSSYLDPRASGWDWTGLNLDDGGALMAFRVRGRNGGSVWAGGSLRRKDGSIARFGPHDVRFDVRRRWRSARTGGVYPVEQVLSVRLPEGWRQFPLKPLFDDQELDGRASGLTVYWEGAVATTGGRGYLELTGYVDRLQL